MKAGFLFLIGFGIFAYAMFKTKQEVIDPDALPNFNGPERRRLMIQYEQQQDEDLRFI